LPELLHFRERGVFSLQVLRLKSRLDRVEAADEFPFAARSASSGSSFRWRAKLAMAKRRSPNWICRGISVSVPTLQSLYWRKPADFWRHLHDNMLFVGAVNEQSFTAASDTYSSSWSCARNVTFSSSVVGSFSADGRTLSGRERLMYRVVGGSELIITFEWTATRT
jgi:hypothetical protein